MAELTITDRVVKNLRARGVKVLTRDEWGSVHGDTYAIRRREKPAKVPADTVFQHITVTLDTGDLTGDFARDVRTVERIGYERFKSGISYNWVVDMKTGMVAVGQPLDAKGTHTVNDKGVPGYSYDQNYWARAIAVLGMEKTPLSLEASESLSSLQAAMMEEGAITKTYDYVPHSLVAYKDCPCDATRSRMGGIRKRAFTMLKKPEPETTPKKSRGQHVDAAMKNLQAAKGSGARGEKIKAALKSLREIQPVTKD